MLDLKYAAFPNIFVDLNCIKNYSFILRSMLFTRWQHLSLLVFTKPYVTVTVIGNHSSTASAICEKLFYHLLDGEKKLN